MPATRTSNDMERHVQAALPEFVKLLGKAVRTDSISRAAYATDASMYQFMPLLVIEPATRAEIIEAIRICHRHSLPILPRGGGTSLVGQPIGHGVVFDVSRNYDRVLEVNATERWVWVEPGITRDELNRTLQSNGLHFAPDPATSSRANIGGMIANNAAGMRSIQYGMTIDHVLELEIALSDGEVMMLGNVDATRLQTPPGNRTDQIIRNFSTIITRERAEIVERFPKVARRSGGYPLDAFTGPLPWNMAKLIAGSEGTLGFILRAKLNLEPLPRHSGICLAHFDSMRTCLRSVKSIMAHQPTAVELLDGLIIRQARCHPLTSSTCSMIQGSPEGLLIIESRADDASHVTNTLAAIQHTLMVSGSCRVCPVITNPPDVQSVWQMRESALGLITTVPGKRKPTPYIEDAAVPLDVLPDYIEDVLAVCHRHQRPVSLFAHAGAGLLHIRPMHDLHQKEDMEQLLQIQDEVFALVMKYKGSWSGEHGDGIIRGGYNRTFFGDQIFRAFEEIKTLFDPAGLMNPGKILHPPPRDAHLRHRDSDTPVVIKPMLTWTEQGGLRQATEQCTGIGACRQLKSGVMCPSYMATRDELHSTRGRANILRLALSGKLGPDALTSDDVMAVFDLCLGCKGCRSECPNKIDVGKMKTELQFQYYQTHRRPLRSHLFAQPAKLGRFFAGTMSFVSNFLMSTRPTRNLLDRFLGIDRRRPLPRYAGQTFSSWYKSHKFSKQETTIRVVLFVDSFTEYHEPDVGKSAIRVLHACGYHVEAIISADSQRPALSHGMLHHARARGLSVFKKLEPFATAGMPILVIEPSCYTAIVQDLPDLIEDQSLIQSVIPHVKLIDHFLAEQMRLGNGRTPEFTTTPGDIFFHPHCHQRSIDKGQSTYWLLQKLPGAKVIMSQAGCCGMAGSFGYEKEHYDLSVRIAGDRLLPALEGLDHLAVVCTSGFSCRHQINDLGKRDALHPLQVLAQRLAAQPATSSA